MKKALYFDVETTGLSAWKNDIIQLAAIVEINGEAVDEINLLIQPHNFDNIDKRALDVHGYSVSDLRGFKPPMEAHKEFTTFLGKYVNKFNKQDKFAPAGFNVKFDCDFLSCFFKKCGDGYYGSWLNWEFIDPMYTLYAMSYMGDIDLPNYKLVTVCEAFEIDIKAHDALSDIRATRELVKMLMSK